MLIERLVDHAEPLANIVKELNAKVVFAESCTAGMVSAVFSMVPGISAHHCGSFATYRPASKRKWLGVRESIIHEHTCESEQMAREMAVRALERTPEADYAASVVGHLGPNAPVNDGLFWIGMADRKTIYTASPHLSHAYQGVCVNKDRVSRQFEIAFKVLDEFQEFLEKHGETK